MGVIPGTGAGAGFFAAAAAAAGLQYVGGTTYVNDADATPNVPLTSLTGGLASAPAAGDIVIVALASGSAGTNRNISATGYTEVADLYSDDTQDANMYVGYKVLSGADTVIDLDNDGGSLTASAVHVWRGQNATPLDVTSTTATGIDTARPNPPSITPTTAGAVVIVMGAGCSAGDDSASPLTQSGSELSNFRAASENNGTTRTVHVAIGSKAWTSGAFDPVAFTGAAADATDSWCAVSLALRPA